MKKYPRRENGGSANVESKLRHHDSLIETILKKLEGEYPRKLSRIKRWKK